MSKCANTVTGTRTRYNCYLMKLKSSSIYVMNALHIVFPIYDRSCDIRKRIDEIFTEKTGIKTLFIEYLTVKKPLLPEIVNNVLEAYVELMGYTHSNHISNPLETMWLYFTRLIYEQPILLLCDSNNGRNVTIIKDSMEQYIAELVVKKE
jgi:hypothetical protein